MQAFTTADNGTTLTPAPGDLASPLDMGDPTAEGTFSLANVYLNPNETYVFLYWANAEGPYDDLTDLRCAYYNIDRIAWAKRSETWKYQESEPTEITAELQHVVAKVTLKTTTNVEADSKITVTVPTTYSTYNVAAGDVIQDAKVKDTSFAHQGPSITGTEDGTEVFSFYALVKDETQNITLTNGTNSQQVTNVPLGPNKHTTLVGDVRNLGLTNVTFTASFVGDWGSTETIKEPEVGEDYTIDFNTHTITLSGANLNKEMVEKALDGTGILVINGESSNMHVVINNYDQITQLTLNDVTTIGDNTLNNLIGLTSLTLPKVTHFGSLFLGNSSNLKYLSLTAEEPITVAYDAIMSIITRDITLTLNANKKDEVTNGNVWQGITWGSILFAE